MRFMFTLYTCRAMDKAPSLNAIYLAIIILTNSS